MQQLIFTIYDQKAEAYIPPFFLPTIGMAKRSFSECVNSESHQFGKFPEDYTLFLVGNFDDNNAEFNVHAPKSQGNGVEFINPDPERHNEIDTEPQV